MVRERAGEDEESAGAMISPMRIHHRDEPQLMHVHAHHDPRRQLPMECVVTVAAGYVARVSHIADLHLR